MIFTTVDTLIRLGTDKLLEFMELTRDELAELMVSEGVFTLEVLAEALSETVMLCPYCGSEYAWIDDGVCYGCRGNIQQKRGWVEVMNS